MQHKNGAALAVIKGDIECIFTVHGAMFIYFGKLKDAW